MRVTDSVVFSSASVETSRARSRLETSLREVSSGVRVESPGDDPTAAALMISHSAAAARMDALSTAAHRASDEITVADGALDTVGSSLQRAREIALMAANDTWSASERKAASVEVEGLFQQAVAALNVRVGDRYVFGGTKDDTPPFDSSGAYSGAADVRKLEIAPGILQDVSVRADVAVKGSGGGVDVLQTLQDLMTALKGGLATESQKVIDPLGSAIDQVARTRSGAGASQVVLDAASSAGELARDASTRRRSELGDVDAIAAASQLAMAQNALESALTAVSSGFKLNILELLR